MSRTRTYNFTVAVRKNSDAYASNTKEAIAREAERLNKRQERETSIQSFLYNHYTVESKQERNEMTDEELETLGQKRVANDDAFMEMFMKHLGL